MSDTTYIIAEVQRILDDTPAGVAFCEPLPRRLMERIAEALGVGKARASHRDLDSNEQQPKPTDE